MLWRHTKNPVTQIWEVGEKDGVGNKK